MKKHQFSAGQTVNLHFNDECVLARVIEKIDDATMVPLTNYWLVEMVVDGGFGRPFGFSAAKMTAA